MNKILKISLLVSLFFIFSCDGDKKVYYDVTDAFLNYPKEDVVDFSISGTAKCDLCLTEGYIVSAIQIDVYPKDKPSSTLATIFLDQLGTFTFEDLQYLKDTELKLNGQLVLSNGNVKFSSTITVDVPEEDGDTISCVLNFPQAGNEI